MKVIMVLVVACFIALAVCYLADDFGDYLPDKESIFKTQQRVSRYLDYYNMKRLHLGIQLRTPLMCCKGIERS